MRFLFCLTLLLVCVGCSDHVVNVADKKQLSFAELQKGDWKEAKNYWKDEQLLIKVVKAREVRGVNDDILMALDIAIENLGAIRRTPYKSGWQDNTEKYDEFSNKYDSRSLGYFVMGILPDENCLVYPGKAKAITLIFDSPVKSAKELRLTLPGANLELERDICLKLDLDWRSKFSQWPPPDKTPVVAQPAPPTPASPIPSTTPTQTVPPMQTPPLAQTAPPVTNAKPPASTPPTPVVKSPNPAIAKAKIPESESKAPASESKEKKKKTPETKNAKPPASTPPTPVVKSPNPAIAKAKIPESESKAPASESKAPEEKTPETKNAETKTPEETPQTAAVSYREWRSKTGKTVKANLIDMQGDFVNLQGEQKKYKVKLADLSQDDQYYVVQEELAKDLNSLDTAQEGTTLSKSLSLQKAVVAFKEKFDGKPIRIAYPIMDVMESKKQNVYLLQLEKPALWSANFASLTANEITLAMNQGDALTIEPNVSIVLIEALLSVKNTDGPFVPFIESNKPIYIISHPSFTLAFALQQMKILVQTRKLQFEAKISKDFPLPKPSEKITSINQEKNRMVAEKSYQARQNMLNRINQRRAEDADLLRRKYLENAARMKVNYNSSVPRFGP